MKKLKIGVIILIIFISIGIISGSVASVVYSNRHKFYHLFFTWFGNGLDYEYALDVGYGCEIVDWIDMNDKTYVITQYEFDKKLEYVKNGEKITLLNSVIAHYFIDWKFYVIATNGYAVMDKNSVARIYTSEDKVSLENVYYLTSFEDFEKEEQELFDSFGFYTKESRQLGIFLIIACLLIVVLVITFVILVIKYSLKK